MLPLRFVLSRWPSHRLLRCFSHCDKLWRMLGLPCLCPTLSTRYIFLGYSPGFHGDACLSLLCGRPLQSQRPEIVDSIQGPALDVQGPGSVSQLISQQLQSQSRPASLEMLGACSGGRDVATEASASAVQSLLSQAAGTAQVTQLLFMNPTMRCVKDTCALDYFAFVLMLVLCYR